MKKLFRKILLPLALLVGTQSSYALESSRTKAIGGIKVCVSDDADNILMENPAGVTKTNYHVSIPDATIYCGANLIKNFKHTKEMQDFISKYVEFVNSDFKTVRDLGHELNFKVRGRDETMLEIFNQYKSIKTEQQKQEYIDLMGKYHVKNLELIANDITETLNYKSQLNNSEFNDMQVDLGCNLIPHLFLFKHLGVGYYADVISSGKMNLNANYRFTDYSYDFESQTMKLTTDSEKKLVEYNVIGEYGFAVVLGGKIKKLSLGLGAKSYQKIKAKGELTLTPGLEVNVAEDNSNINVVDDFSLNFVKGKGFSTNLGMIYDFNKHFSTGLVVNNLTAKEIKYNDGNTEKPRRSIDLGCAGRFKGLLIGADVEDWPSKSDIHLGAEYRLGTKNLNVTPRIGYDKNYMAGGLGLRLLLLDLNYSLSRGNKNTPYHELGFSFRL